ncbi:hypothetical protein CRG98_007634 [Punica granatum]|uniref:Uncharacterized protein n=1 Tax=Punica granatum TaxID=22663 RepID=A0A2I0KU06_PUNGR|nr:hypothetical protein CRG98_007634 [Punica granatum]
MERDTTAVAGTKWDASHDLWLHPLIERATKEGQAVSTPFWSTGSNREHPTKARVIHGLCTFETVHERLDLFLRSPRNSTSLGAVVGAVVPTLFFSDCHGHYFSGACCSRVQPGHPILLPLPRLFPCIPRLGIIPLRL